MRQERSIKMTACTWQLQHRRGGRTITSCFLASGVVFSAPCAQLIS